MDKWWPLFLPLLSLLIESTRATGFLCLHQISLCDCDPTRLAVDCSNLRFVSIPRDSSVIPNVTSSIRFGGNRLTSVTRESFVNLRQLSSISLSNNHIEFVEPGSFGFALDLGNLDLSGNMLRSLPTAVTTLTSLRVLNMSANTLSHLHVHDFQNLTRLEVLRLENNALVRILENTFHPLSHLELLSLDGNYISADPIGWFVNCPRLTQLRMSYNRLTLNESAVEYWFGSESFISLEELRLGGNLIVNISERTFRRCENLVELHLDANQIVTVAPGSFSGLSRRLKVLNISANKLAALPDNLFLNTSNIVTLSLQDNYLHMPSIGVFQGLNQLVLLNLARNRLESIFRESCGEGGIVCDGPYLPSLERLFLNSNFLSSVPNFRNFPGLKTLDISGNNIPKLGSYVFNGTSLRRLYLANNLLTTLSEDSLEVLPALELVTLIGNPWSCDCLLHWLVDPTRQLSVWQADVMTAVVCNSPPAFRGRSLSSLYIRHKSFGDVAPFVPCRTIGWRGPAAIASVWVVILAIVVVCYLRRKVGGCRGSSKPRPPRPAETEKATLPLVTVVTPATSPPSTAGNLNWGATIASTPTDITYVVSSQPELATERDGDEECEGRPQPKRTRYNETRGQAAEGPTVTEISTV